MKLHSTLFAILTLFGATSFASPNTSKTTSMVIDFSKGVTSLTPAQKSELREGLQKFASNDVELDIEVAAWADEPFPGNQKKLSAAQRKIATNRLEATKRYLEELKLDIDDMEVYNMAEGSNWLARVFDTDGNEVKKALSKDREDDSLMKKKFQIFKEKGAPGKSVIFVTLDD